jgi:hypothetical protein
LAWAIGYVRVIIHSVKMPVHRGQRSGKKALKAQVPGGQVQHFKALAVCGKQAAQLF